MSHIESFGYVCVVLSFAAIVICYVTPYWLIGDGDYIIHPVHKGLLALCNNDTCTWLVNDRQIHDQLPVWFKATQGLMSSALALGILALIVATLSLCCTCHSCNPHQPICGFLIVASLCIAVAVVVFGIKANQEWKIDFQMDISSSGRFGWSFWTAIGAAGGALLTSVIYCCMDRKSS
ncbi:uncharacterized protein LOC127851091 isoform X8 [Dreissena polymorpha]|uniref:uncharacterized protein LOC127851091 isoform X6 n=1 Tax=Dreissena polymorpha TaxID=45954 RepID=UPI0022651D29|nr:uncharacterized protein LOC127851091 isoform X6 [Dreissena polymorpha]XP_052240557.1 uncharacterized protein LOC127851091 isoform X6 [Dreissena polymorpha]XP_052240558.1 uncharacterized protein LOC127851091 isoform X6 [Dreissena polymorpha]XP_052240559.1 uncharacterized protein LOC127851091 isoform X6 [Dreissena polymorpha]XP_052240560.1 uncharacterized protein LOC127851091 isoform X6 [Dreissena polymorpha]XP_052240561.1 uncharacterized protein LOC127851091 isoform X6 [Dreissena polymorpha]